MKLPPIISVMSKKQIVDMFVATRKGENTEEEFQTKFDEVLEYVYNEGRTHGLSEALNYVENEADRQRIFKGLELMEVEDEK